MAHVHNNDPINENDNPEAPIQPIVIPLVRTSSGAEYRMPNYAWARAVEEGRGRINPQTGEREMFGIGTNLNTLTEQERTRWTALEEARRDANVVARTGIAEHQQRRLRERQRYLNHVANQVQPLNQDPLPMLTLPAAAPAAGGRRSRRHRKNKRRNSRKNRR